MIEPWSREYLNWCALNPVYDDPEPDDPTVDVDMEVTVGEHQKEHIEVGDIITVGAYNLGYFGLVAVQYITPGEDQTLVLGCDRVDPPRYVYANSLKIFDASEDV